MIPEIVRTLIGTTISFVCRTGVQIHRKSSSTKEMGQKLCSSHT